MNIFDLFMVFYLLIGTILLNAYRNKLKAMANTHRYIYLLVAVLAAVAPFIYLQENQQSHTAWSVILVGITLFWFAILGGRIANT